MNKETNDFSPREHEIASQFQQILHD